MMMWAKSQLHLEKVQKICNLAIYSWLAIRMNDEWLVMYRIQFKAMEKLSLALFCFHRFHQQIGCDRCDLT